MKRLQTSGFQRTVAFTILFWISAVSVGAGDDKITENLKPKILIGHQMPVVAVAFSKDNKSLISASFLGIVNQWPLNGTKHRTNLSLGWAGYSSCLSQDGNTLAFACSEGGADEIRIWNTSALKPPKIPKPRLVLKGNDEDFTAMTMTPDGTRLAAGDEAGIVRIWDLQTGKILHSVKAHEDVVFAVAFAPNGEFVATGGGDGVIMITGSKMKSQKIIATELEISMISALAFSSDGKLLSSCTADMDSCELVFWNVPKYKKINSVKISETTYFAKMVFSPDNETLAVSSETRIEKKIGPRAVEYLDLGGIQLWDVKSLKLKKTLISKHPQTFSSLVYSKDGKKLLAGCHDAGIYLWSLK